VKLNSQEFLEGGYTVEDMVEVASLLEKAGIDAVEMSGGNHVAGILGEFFPARKAKPGMEERPYYLDEAHRYKERIRVPLMLVGGVRSLGWAKRIVSEGYADYVSLCRPLIREPGLIARWQSGDAANATCVSDNGCFKPALEGKEFTAPSRLKSVSASSSVSSSWSFRYKRGEGLLHSLALTLWTPDALLFLLVFTETQDQRKRVSALLTVVFVRRHMNPPSSCNFAAL